MNSEYIAISCWLLVAAVDDQPQPRFDAGMWKKSIGVLGGLTAGVIIGAVGRQLWLVADRHSLAPLLDDAIVAVGSLRWVDTTLVTGMLAVAAAYFTIRQSEKQENQRIDAKYAAARAVLPLALSQVSQYSDELAESLRETLDLCVHGILPKTATMPDYPELPPDLLEPIKEMIEHSGADDRRMLWQMLIRIQIIRTRIAELKKSHARTSSIVSDLNLHAYIVDAAEIHARASALFQFARGAQKRPPKIVTGAMMASALLQVGIYDDLHEHLVKKYGLSGPKQWGENWSS